MPGSTPAISQLDWLSSTTAMIVLSWSKATSDLLKSFSWGIVALRPSPVTAVEGRRGPPVNRPLPIVLRYRRRERWVYGEEQEMKAIRCREWGAPDVLRFEEAESPNLKQHQ